MRIAAFFLFTCSLVLSALSAQAATPGVSMGSSGPNGGGQVLVDKNKAIDEGPFYYALPVLVLPVIGDNGPEQLVTLVITLQTETMENMQKVKENMPRLSDAYMQALYGALDKHTVNRGSLIDVSLVKARLFKPTTAVLGPDVASEILVQAVAQRKL